MASIGNLVVNLTANTSKFQSGMASAEQTVNRMAAAAVAMGTAAIVVLARTGDEFDKMSKRTGIAVEELSRLGFAAEQSGTDINSLEGGLRKMSKLMLDADRGLSTATKTMEALGITTKELSGKSQTERFGIFADAIKDIKDPALKTALAMEVFGRGGTALIPMINEGAAGMRALAEESDALGATVTKTQSILGADLTDAFNRVKVSGEGFLRTLAEGLAPAVIKTADAIAYAVSGLRAFAPVIVFIGTAVTVAAVAMKAITAATWLYTKAKVVAMSLSGPKGWAILAGSVLVAAAATVAITKAMDNSAAAIVKAESAVDGETAALSAAAAEAAKLAAATDAADKKTEALRKTMAAMETPTQRVARSVAEFQAALVAADTGIVWNNHPLVKAMREKESGFSSMLASVGDELAILRGDATETGLQLSKMLEMGVDPSRIDELRGKLEEIANINTAKDNADYWAGRMKSLASQADEIKKAIATPDEMIRVQQKSIDQLVGAGLLTKEQGEQSMKQFSKQFDKPTVPQSDTKFASTMQRGSADAFSAIVKAMSGKTPESKELEKQTKEIKALPKHIARAMHFKELHRPKEQPAV
jgi:hypothetical protein